MKVGIVTFHRAINYGAVLQTYALQRALGSIGVEAEVLDYRCDYLEKNYSVLQRLKNTKGLRGLAAVFAKCAVPAIKKKLMFNKWINKRIKLSRPYKENIAQSNDEYDVFITGSDQVWNYKHTNFDKNYFLDFVQDNTRKFSYAASFGFSELDQEYIAPYRELLEGFSRISVRETSGAKLVDEILGVPDVPVVVDPVFLMQEQDWNVKEQRIKNKYILIYELMPSDDVVRFALQLAHKHNLQIIRITNILQRAPHKRIKNVWGVSPQAFLEYISNAEYVVTNSFHGTAFSMLFNKQFYVCRLTDTMAKLNARLDDMLAVYGLEDRVVGTGTDENSIDYGPIRIKLEEERQKGILFLKETVSKTVL